MPFAPLLASAVALLAAIGMPATARAATVDVNCSTQNLQTDGLDAASPGDTIRISGTCGSGPFTVKKSNVTIQGLTGTGTDSIVSTLRVDGATNVTLQNFDATLGSGGIFIRWGASVHIDNVNFTLNNGLCIQRGSYVDIANSTFANGTNTSNPTCGFVLVVDNSHLDISNTVLNGNIPGTATLRAFRSSSIRLQGGNTINHTVVTDGSILANAESSLWVSNEGGTTDSLNSSVGIANGSFADVREITIATGTDTAMSVYGSSRARLGVNGVASGVSVTGNILVFNDTNLELDSSMALTGNLTCFGTGNINTATINNGTPNVNCANFAFDGSDNLGLGTRSPASPLHVSRSDGTAKVTVEETNAAVAARTLFELKNPGNTKFTLNNTNAGVEWSFTNSGSDFRVSRQGSGVVEFAVANNGNVSVNGAIVHASSRALKEDIVTVDPQSVLEKVAALPVALWTYKHDDEHARHLGPMAEDFAASFGLGHGTSGIATVDADGVALAAIQGLNQKLKQKDLQIEQLSSRLEALENELMSQRNATH